jgi:phosphoribosylamine---glycine ligase
MTKILVIGSGGREHALVWKLNQSDCTIFCAPGNGGISDLAQCVPIKADDLSGLLTYTKQEKIDLTIVGPEVPLGMGIVDLFQENNLKIFGPNKKAAQLESSKHFTKNFCRKYGLPTPNFESFTDSASARNYIETKKFPIVIKASGLAAGKGVIIVENKEQALMTIDRIIEKKEFGKAGETIVIEDFICGREVSMLAFCDGNTIIPMIPARDHKPLLDGNKGPNTGGMGSYTPIPEFKEKWITRLQAELFDPMIKALKKEDIEYKGIIYAGLIVADNNFYILEFNCRWGDPETEVLIPLLKTDLVSLCFDTIDGKLKQVEWKDEYALTVIAASGGYPDKYETGKLITGDLANNDNTMIFHCGTKKENNKYFTAGGRVLAVTGIGKTLSQAREKSYTALKNITFDKMYYRTDIGK